MTGVFVNGHAIPKSQFVPLNDNDLISIGGNFNENEAGKRNFLYRVLAPKKVDENLEDSDFDDEARKFYALFFMIRKIEKQ